MAKSAYVRITPKNGIEKVLLDGQEIKNVTEVDFHMNECGGKLTLEVKISDFAHITTAEVGNSLPMPRGAP